MIAFRSVSFALGLLIGCSSPAWAVEVDAVGITVNDMDKAVAFYKKVLEFKVMADREVSDETYERLSGVFGARVRMVRMRLGNEHLELIEYLAPRGRPMPIDTRSNDHWFQHVAIIVSDMDQAYQKLRKHRVEHASSGPQRLPEWNAQAAGIEAFYFRDPDGNHLEILRFPDGKGDPKWQSSNGRLFLGIDHTAIVVADTERSLKFYRDGVGLEVAGESENYGSEQEHLNNVFGARLRITALRGQGGIGVEFLEYLTPSGGRPIPKDTQANDLWHWQVHIVDGNPVTLTNRLLVRGAQQVSNGVAPLSVSVLRFGNALMVRDPDGHANLIHDRKWSKSV